MVQIECGMHVSLNMTEHASFPQHNSEVEPGDESPRARGPTDRTGITVRVWGNAGMRTRL